MLVSHLCFLLHHLVPFFFPSRRLRSFLPLESAFLAFLAPPVAPTSQHVGSASSITTSPPGHAPGCFRHLASIPALDPRWVASLRL